MGTLNRETATPRPRFKRRTWGTLRLSHFYETWPTDILSSILVSTMCSSRATRLFVKRKNTASKGPGEDGPDNRPLIFSITPVDRTSKLLSFREPQPHGGCPRVAGLTLGL